MSKGVDKVSVIKRMLSKCSDLEKKEVYDYLRLMQGASFGNLQLVNLGNKSQDDDEVDSNLTRSERASFDSLNQAFGFYSNQKLYSALAGILKDTHGVRWPPYNVGTFDSAKLTKLVKGFNGFISENKLSLDTAELLLRLIVSGLYKRYESTGVRPKQVIEYLANEDITVLLNENFPGYGVSVALSLIDFQGV